VLLFPGSKKQVGASHTTPLSPGVAFKEHINDALSPIVAQRLSGPSVSVTGEKWE